MGIGQWCVFLSYLSRSLADRCGTNVDFTTSFLHSSRFSAFRSSIFHSRPVHSLMLSSHHFLCLPLRLPPWTVPCRTVLASPDDHVTCLYHFSLRLFIEVRKSSYGPMAFPILAFTFSLVMWFLYISNQKQWSPASPPTSKRSSSSLSTIKHEKAPTYLGV